MGGRLVSEIENYGSIQLKIADSLGKEFGDIQIELKSNKDNDVLVKRHSSIPDSDFFCMWIRLRPEEYGGHHQPLVLIGYMIHLLLFSIIGAVS